MPGVTPQQVWDLIRPAEAALQDPTVVEAYTEPGTGPGVGEIQVFVYEVDGARRVSQVTHGVDHAPGEHVPDHVIGHREFTSGFSGWVRTALAQ